MPRRVVVLGAGATGEAFVAALRRLDPEAEITVVERELVGGECSYWACIPSKTMLRPLEVVARARLAPGVVPVPTADPELVFQWRDEIAEKDDSSPVEWLRRKGARLVRGSGVVAGPGLVVVDEQELPYDALLVATGSVPVEPPIDGLDELPHWDSRQATSARAVPETLAVIGGGAVGCELSQAYARLGARVTLVPGADHLLPRVDPEAADILGAAFEQEGIEVLYGAKATRVEGGDGVPYRLELEGRGPVEAEQLLVATGRKPNVEGFGLEQLDVTIGRDGLQVDERLAAGETTWAAGDVTGRALFTHVGKYQARIAAANVAGREARADYRAVPATIFTDPQVAMVGDTSGEGAVTASWKLESVSRTATYQRPKQPGLLKLYADPERGVLVGATAVGPEAGEWLGQLTLAVRAEVPVEVLRDTIQPFPSFSEAVYFTARDLAL